MNREELKRMRRVARRKQLERNALVGRPRAKSWGGKRFIRVKRVNTDKE